MNTIERVMTQRYDWVFKKYPKRRLRALLLGHLGMAPPSMARWLHLLRWLRGMEGVPVRPFSDEF
jgi:hypothetical protein